jgi:hypothetical protein
MVYNKPNFYPSVVTIKKPLINFLNDIKPINVKNQTNTCNYVKEFEHRSNLVVCGAAVSVFTTPATDQSPWCRCPGPQHLCTPWSLIAHAGHTLCPPRSTAHHQTRSPYALATIALCPDTWSPYPWPHTITSSRRCLLPSPLSPRVAGVSALVAFPVPVW